MPSPTRPAGLCNILPRCNSRYSPCRPTIQMAAIWRRRVRLGQLPAVCTPRRPPPPAPLGQNRTAEKSFLGKLRPADALRLGTLANRRAYPVGSRRHPNHPPHRLRRARLFTAVRGTAFRLQIASQLDSRYCVGSPSRRTLIFTHYHQAKIKAT